MSNEKKVFGIVIGKGNNAKDGAKGGGKPGLFGKKGKQEDLTQITEEEKAAFVYTPQIPIVNIIPNEIFDKYQIKGTLRRLGGIAVLAALVLGAIYGAGALLTKSQEDTITNLQAEQQLVKQSSDALAPYENYKFDVDGKRATLLAGTSYDVAWDYIYSAILQAKNNAPEMSLQTLSVSQTDQNNPNQSSACVTPDPFETFQSDAILIGCITFKGSALSKEGINGFLRQLINYAGPDSNGMIHPNEWFRDDYINLVNEAPPSSPAYPSVNFEASIGFTDRFYTQQYSSLLQVPIDELILELREGIVKPGENVITNPGEVELPEPGPAGETALGIMNTLLPEEVRQVDTISYSYCTSTTPEDFALYETLEGLFTEAYPDLDPGQINVLVTTLADFVPANCVAIIEQEEAI